MVPLNSSTQNVEQPGFFRRIFINPVGNLFYAIGNCFCGRSSQSNTDYNTSSIENSMLERIPCYTRYSEEVGKLFVIIYNSN